MSVKPTTRGNGEIVRDQKKPEASLLTFIEKHSADFALVLPKHITPERMTRLAISAVRTTPKLAECSVVSFAASLMACSALGLEPNTPLGHAYLIPRWNSRIRGMECTLIIGYRGLMDLMYRSGVVANVKAEVVFKGDIFEYEKGLQPKLKHIPCGEDDPEKITHVYTIVRWKDGGEPVWDVLTLNQILKRRNRGGYDPEKSSPWKSDFEAMCQKTGVRSIAKWAPVSTERAVVTQAIAYEEASERGLGHQAIAMLGEGVRAGLENMGAFPTDGELVEETQEQGERVPGEEG